ncbi:hypothetical protein FB45DRAFT_273682 [Roridomyces roridus]|uniref:Uncharacterized protein n=1 Tax=Roridomyces roridus TaxID=1738132 RepID=A0AAD7FD67_9AGAR|nr:hypothetical protein FB45DRAFT_273682 [Roridomyces roridus]
MGGFLRVEGVVQARDNDTEPICPHGPLDNDSGVGPCEVSVDVCFFTSQEETKQEQCGCTAVSYFLDEACRDCKNAEALNWSTYSGETLGCEENAPPIQSIPSPGLSAGPTTLPAWVVAMASATPTPTNFNAQAATRLALSIDPGKASLLSSASASPNSSSTPVPSSTASSTGYRNRQPPRRLVLLRLPTGTLSQLEPSPGSLWGLC